VLVPPPAPEAPPDELVIHIVWIVPHPKFLDLFRDKVAVVGPNYQNTRVVAHAVLDDTTHPRRDLAPQVRMALVENGFATPEEVGYTYPLQVEAGWQKEPDE
jgi:hypothetical protein